MASIIQLQHGVPEFGGRIAGAAYELAREKGVMLAPVKVLHLPDPGDLMGEQLGAEASQNLLAVGAATPRSEIISEILTAVPPSQ